MSITASDVAKLRSLTGAGMMDCKKALEEADGDMEKAAEILRKKGIVKAAKRTEKIAADGTTVVKERDNVAVVLELNSETDFVAKNEEFKKMADEFADYLLDHKPSSLEDAMNLTVNGETLQDKITGIIAKIGEKITLRRIAVVEKTDADAFGAYSHMGGKISVLVLLKNTADSEFAREVAMHAAAANPKYINRTQVPSEVVDKEKEIYGEQLRQQGKPEQAIEKIMTGKIDKYFSEVCLLEQSYFKDEDKTVKQIVAEKGADVEIAEMYRFELGEGIEKKNCDFAAEVEEQLK